MKNAWTILAFLFLGACASKPSAPEPPVLLRFVADQDLGLVVHPVKWNAAADQDNPGVDCTLKLETQGPPENIYSCVVKDARNVFIVKISESYQSELEDRHLSKITVDSKWASTRDLWVEELRQAHYKESPKNPSGSVGDKWEFTSPNEDSVITVFWNKRAGAVTAWVLPKSTETPAKAE